MFVAFVVLVLSLGARSALAEHDGKAEGGTERRTAEPRDEWETWARAQPWGKLPILNEGKIPPFNRIDFQEKKTAGYQKCWVREYPENQGITTIVRRSWSTYYAKTWQDCYRLATTIFGHSGDPVQVDAYDNLLGAPKTQRTVTNRVEWQFDDGFFRDSKGRVNGYSDFLNPKKGDARGNPRTDARIQNR